MAKSTKDKILDTMISMITRDFTRTALNKFKAAVADTSKKSKKASRKPEEKDEELEP